MKDLRYPEFVNALLEGTEEKQQEEALKTALEKLFADMEEDQIIALYDMLGFDMEDWNDDIAASDNYMQGFIKQNEEFEEPDSLADFLDNIAITITDEFDAYGWDYPSLLE